MNFETELVDNECTELAVDALDEIHMCKSLVALANHKGGKLIFGINPKSKVIGCYPKEVLDRLSKLISKHCININLSESFTHTVKSKLILEVNISKTLLPARITNMNEINGYYIRNNNSNIKLGKVVERYYQLLARDESKRIITDTNQELLKIIKKDGPLTLTQLYVKSVSKKNEIDKYLTCMLLSDEVKFTIVEGTTYFH